MKEQLKELYDRMDSKNEAILTKVNFCKEHNFGLQADSLYNSYQHGRELLWELRAYISDL